MQRLREMASLVSQDSAPASSSCPARSPSDALHDSAADRPLASPPSVADAAAEDGAPPLSLNVISRGADIVSHGCSCASAKRLLAVPCLKVFGQSTARGSSRRSPPFALLPVFCVQPRRETSVNRDFLVTRLQCARVRSLTLGLCLELLASQLALGAALVAAGALAARRRSFSVLLLSKLALGAARRG